MIPSRYQPTAPRKSYCEHSHGFANPEQCHQEQHHYYQQYPQQPQPLNPQDPQQHPQHPQKHFHPPYPHQVPQPIPQPHHCHHPQHPPPFPHYRYHHELPCRYQPLQHPSSPQEPQPHPAAAAAAAVTGARTYFPCTSPNTPCSAEYYWPNTPPSSSCPMAFPKHQQQHHLTAIAPASAQRQEPILPHQNDVLMGRGGKNNTHSGNETLRNMARELRDQYIAASKKDKSNMSRDLVKRIHSLKPPGRFLKRNQVSAEWEVVDVEYAREKASQCLRDAVTMVKPDRGVDTSGTLDKREDPCEPQAPSKEQPEGAPASEESSQENNSKGRPHTPLQRGKAATIEPSPLRPFVSPNSIKAANTITIQHQSSSVSSSMARPKRKRTNMGDCSSIELSIPNDMPLMDGPHMIPPYHDDDDDDIKIPLLLGESPTDQHSQQMEEELVNDDSEEFELFEGALLDSCNPDEWMNLADEDMVDIFETQFC